MKKIVSLIACTLSLCSLSLRADEGMWLVNLENQKIQEFGKAIVSVDFMGTGSIISKNGLVITNHHVAYGDIFAISTPENNLLDNGFWARTPDQEIPIKGRSMQILEKTLDVTDEVNQLIESGQVKPGLMMMRRLGGILEKKYAEQTGLVPSLGSFWRGEKYYLALYKEYKDIRLVAAPPASVGSFGGDIDNWEWPQHKGDFAMYRIYTAPDGSCAEYAPENVPLKSENCLKISTKGYKEGTKTMVIGYPGSTDRFASSAKVGYMVDVVLPITTTVKGGQMDILKKWMEKDESVKLRYADHFFSLSNAQEYYLGELQCYKRFKVCDLLRESEKELQEWIDASPERKAKWGTLIGDLQAKYSAVAKAEKDVNTYRECLARGTKLSAIASRTQSLRTRCDKDKIEGVKRSGRSTYSGLDLRVERDIFRFTLAYYFDNVDHALLGKYQKELFEKFGTDYDAMCAFLWDKSWMTTEDGVRDYLNPECDLQAKLDELLLDPLVMYFNDIKIVNFNSVVNEIEGTPTISELAKEYTHALYEMRLDKKQKVYPDANSTLRVTYGKVCAYSPKDAVFCDWYSTARGLIEKYDPSSIDYYMKEDWYKILCTADPDMKIDFISDNDITGGNSGSPILNSKGEILGLCFDGNKESLASEVSFTDDYNRCVNTDIRYVLWILRNYAHLDRILEEIGQ